MRTLSYCWLRKGWLCLAMPVLLSISACSEEKSNQSVMATSETKPEEPTGKVEKTDEEWKKLLTPDQYRILRKAGTEAPHGKVYKEFKEQGVGSYHCAGCGAMLFSSKEKFDSGCGWPSFYDPAKAENVKTKVDNSLGATRVEVVCSKCEGHLGHVFEGEGFETPTDKRYCINGVGLRFVPGEVKAADKKPE